MRDYFLNALSSALVNTKLFEFPRKRTDGIDGLTVTLLVLEGEVDVEHILPLLTDDGERLNFCQIEFVEREDREDGAETAFLVRQREDQAGFVDGPGVSDSRRLLRMGQNQEAREVVLVRLDAFLQDLHAVYSGCVAMTDGRVSVSLLPADVGCGTGCVGDFDDFQVRVARQEVATLHQSDRVGIDLGQVVPTLVGQAHDAVTDTQFVLSYDGHSAVSQQFVVVEQAACDGILDGHKSQQVGFTFQPREHLLESVAANQFHLLVLEEAMSSDIVEAAFDALYCYPFHPIKNPASPSERDCMYVVYVLYLIIYIRRPASLHLLK